MYLYIPKRNIDLYTYKILFRNCICLWIRRREISQRLSTIRLTRLHDETIQYRTSRATDATRGILAAWWTANEYSV